MSTQKAIAKKLGLTEQMLSFLLKGRRNLTYTNALRISEILNCDPTIWLHGGGTPDQRRDAIGTNGEASCQEAK